MCTAVDSGKQVELKIQALTVPRDYTYEATEPSLLCCAAALRPGGIIELFITLRHCDCCGLLLLLCQYNSSIIRVYPQCRMSSMIPGTVGVQRWYIGTPDVCVRVIEQANVAHHINLGLGPRPRLPSTSIISLRGLLRRLGEVSYQGEGDH